MMNNVTSEHTGTNTTSEDFGPLLLAFNYLTLCVGIVIVFCEIGAVLILQRCKRTPLCSRILSTNFILSDAAGSFIFVVHQIVIFGFGINNDVTHNARILVVGTTLAVSWASVASMSLERVIAIKINIKYNLNASKLKIYLWVCFIWAANILVVAIAVLSGTLHHCKLSLDFCDIWKASKAGRFVMMGLLMFYEIVLVVSYVIIHRVALRHIRNIVAPKRTTLRQANYNNLLTNRQYAATRVIVKIVLAFMLLHAPIVIHLFIFEGDVSLRNEKLRRVFHAISYLCIQTNSFVSVHLYIAKFDECKLHFYLILSRVCKSYEKQAEELRVKVYDIVLSTKTNNDGRSPNIPEVRTCTSMIEQSNTV